MRLPDRAVVIAPHPDDETLGVGGTIARLSQEGTEVSVLVVSGHLPPLYDPSVFQITRSEAESAFQVLGVRNYEFLEIPATQVNEVAIARLNSLISSYLKTHDPQWVFIPFPDRHIDHRVIFDASVVACRPVGSVYPRVVLSYETLSETHWNVPNIEPNFSPELFVDISSNMKRKVKALKKFQSQLINSPSRSLEAIEALAKFRGSQNGCSYAEAFKVVRIII